MSTYIVYGHFLITFHVFQITISVASRISTYHLFVHSHLWVSPLTHTLATGLEFRTLVCFSFVIFGTLCRFPSRDNWARNTSINKNAKIFIGAPASSTAAGGGFQPIGTFQSIAKQMRNSFPSFGGNYFVCHTQYLFVDMHKVWCCGMLVKLLVSNQLCFCSKEPEHDTLCLVNSRYDLVCAFFSSISKSSLKHHL